MEASRPFLNPQPISEPLLWRFPCKPREGPIRGSPSWQESLERQDSTPTPIGNWSRLDWLWLNSSFPGTCEIPSSLCWHLGPHETGTWRVRVEQGLGGLPPTTSTPTHQGPSPQVLLPPMGSICGGISCGVYSSHLVGVGWGSPTRYICRRNCRGSHLPGSPSRYVQSPFIAGLSDPNMQDASAFTYCYLTKHWRTWGAGRKPSGHGWRPRGPPDLLRSSKG